ncbi:MAG: FAD-linked oxidase C-terminal domain-containing protein [Arenimonas sp.]
MLPLDKKMQQALLQIFSANSCLFDPAECLAYGYDNSRRQALPQAVVLPTTKEQVQALVQLCREYQTPIVARGRGTNTTGASVPIEGGIVVSFERMNRILEIRAGDRVAIVEPGVLNGDLQAVLKSHGLFWPPDPTSAAYSSIGGNLACNAGGPRAIKYGASRDNVLAVTAITGTSDLVHCGAAVTKSSSGYDLSRLLIGSEGTLGLIIEASLKLSALPAQRQILRALYRDVESAAQAVASIMSQAVIPSMLEFLDGECVRLVRELACVELQASGAMLIIEIDGDIDTLPYSLSTLEKVARNEGCIEIRAARNQNEIDELMAARKALSPLLRTISSGKINEDVVVPVSQVPSLCRQVAGIAKQQSLKIVCFGHIGNGNIHVNILYDKQDESEAERALAAMSQVFTCATSLGGQLSGEHGIGLAKRDFMKQAIDAPTLALMRDIKRCMDPMGILNPGKILPP